MFASPRLHVQDEQVVFNGHVVDAQVEKKHLFESARHDRSQGHGKNLPIPAFESTRPQLVQTYASGQLLPGLIRPLRFCKGTDLLRRSKGHLARQYLHPDGLKHPGLVAAPSALPSWCKLQHWGIKSRRNDRSHSTHTVPGECRSNENDRRPI